MHWRFLSVRVVESNCTFILNLSMLSLIPFFVRVGGALECFNFFFKEGEKNFEILLLGWLCKLFDKALVEALVREALAMCLQMRWQLFFPIISFRGTTTSNDVLYIVKILV